MQPTKQAWLLAWFLAASAGAVSAAPNSAADPMSQRGREIAEEADKRNSGWSDMRADLIMSLKNAYGEQSRRALRLRTLEVPGEGDKSLVVFDEPADVKGAALLSHAYVTKADDQWLYFPATKRVKRIASTNKSGPFMGGEFAYEDMSPWELNKYSYKLAGEKQVQGMDAWVLEMVPQYEDSGYTRQVTMLDKQELRPLQTEYYDRKGTLLKTQVFSGYTKHLDRYWRATKMEMVNHQTQKQTVLTWQNYAFKSGLSDNEFNKDALLRGQ
jgi:outer membrane lipoprotein-sorting protein